MIDALFGSKTRVKLLNLFFNNPGKVFYVREITRIVDEQVNSVRRELSNMQNVGVVKSATKDRKLFYGVNQRYKYYTPLRAIFADVEMAESSASSEVSTDIVEAWQEKIKDIKRSVKIFVISGVLVNDSTSLTDMLLVADMCCTWFVTFPSHRRMPSSDKQDLAWGALTPDSVLLTWHAWWDKRKPVKFGSSVANTMRKMH